MKTAVSVESQENWQPNKVKKSSTSLKLSNVTTRGLQCFIKSTLLVNKSPFQRAFCSILGIPSNIAPSEVPLNKVLNPYYNLDNTTKMAAHYSSLGMGIVKVLTVLLLLRYCLSIRYFNSI